MSGALAAAVAARALQPLPAALADAVPAFAARLAAEADAQVVLFYGSNLRTGSLDGVLDFYVLLAGPPERGVWPTVRYREWTHVGTTLRAKIATMTLTRFARAASGELIDTTVWTRFVQRAALVWSRDPAAQARVLDALAAAAITAARLAAVLGPAQAPAGGYWDALFAATYRAEFRIERGGRAGTIHAADPAAFDALLPLAWSAAGIAWSRDADGRLSPRVDAATRAAVRRWWRRRRRLGKPLNLLRLVRAGRTFEGAARYAAWKIERHSGMAVRLSPWRERHPLLAAPAVLWALWRHRRKAAAATS